MSNKVLALLENTEALLKGHFLLTSGMHSNIYIEKFRLLEEPDSLDYVCDKMAMIVKTKKVDLVIGAAIGGILIAGGVGRHLNKKHIFSERVDGKMELKRGFHINKGDRVVIVEDIITTGGSVRELIQLAEKFGENPEVCNAIGAHHDEIEMNSLISPLVQVCDAVSGSRPGARRQILDSYINLNNEIPYVNVKPHPWRRLKTKGSQRKVPLVGSSLWACERLLANNNDSIYAFPRYTDHNKCNSNSASAALNKWLRSHAPDGCVVHSFRHSMRDRLRAVECPKEIIDQIGGWSSSDVGESYGDGYPIEILRSIMTKSTF